MSDILRNPLPVDRFSPAEAIRRTWPQLMESLLEAVCLVEPEGLRIVAANSQAGRLHGVPPSSLVGQDMRDLAATPEDHVFWREVGDGRWTGIMSDSWVSCGEQAVPVTRRVSRIEPAPGVRLYVVAWRDRREEVTARQAVEVAAEELAATLESLPDAVWVTDDAGRTRRLNQRFAELWEIPGEMLALGADDELAEHLLARVDDPRAWRAWIEADEADPERSAVDEIRLADGRRVERRSTPHRTHGVLLGRVHTFRLLA